MDRSDGDRRLPRVCPDTGGDALLRCAECRVTFPRSDARIPTKGTLTCPECHSTDVRDVDRD
ncbi:hypothetical protein RBH26_14840 [Natronolimnohabitans sp. A-GB9]|uniref:hypothetical protein n=1 Tax=Natronolimnohabitans sp. A-GB9 TaxID=3069757 RepID=UPI0027B109B0|nr:hypothetical protein [Natronolimnohabitans sp. A-GB9]MDQ2051753.1 hypothetical protein [Natronolimnohabitans sp. A-GB9]